MVILLKKRMNWLFQPFEKDIQEGLCICSVFAFIIMILLAMINWKYGLLGRLPKCFLLQKTGLWCPACGGTRAFDAMCHGHLIKSFFWNPVVLYGTYLEIRILTGRIKNWSGVYCFNCEPVHLLFICFLMGMNFILKNI